MIIKEFLEDIEKNNGKIALKVKSGANENKIFEKMLDGTWKIAINAVRENGKANKELIKFLSKITKHKKDEIKIISGQTQEYKIIEWKKKISG